MQALWAVVHGLDRASKRMGQQLGITGPQRLVLRVVGLFPGLSAGDLAAVLHVHPSTLTGVLQRLAVQGLIVRLRDPQDRRRTLLRLTAKGNRANGTRKGTIEEAVAAALATVSSGDRLATTQLLERLIVHVRPVESKAGARPSGTRR
jgi:DNA-binding MarR family transcriptional regulator